MFRRLMLLLEQKKINSSSAKRTDIRAEVNYIDLYSEIPRYKTVTVCLVAIALLCHHDPA